METESRIVVFDGLCNLCSGGARWLEQHQSKPPFRLVLIQSDLGRALLSQHGYDPDDPLTFLVLGRLDPSRRRRGWMAATSQSDTVHSKGMARFGLPTDRAEPISLV
jgi:predicted DCC family thiol-disulfide oxidoreductase YuxK